MIYSGTGHRPEGFGGYKRCSQLTRYLSSILPGYSPTKIISGMALGFDQSFAHAAVENGIPFIAAVPFLGQADIWPKEAQEEYEHLLSLAEDVVIVCEGGFAPHKYIKRDHWMSDHANAMLALWDGRKKGGTYQCLSYSKQIKLPVYNVWPGWLEFCELSHDTLDTEHDRPLLCVDPLQD
jgi:uncharacterized phage-like protein YoqJ